MIHPLSLNGKTHHFAFADLPMLVHGIEKKGASQFTVSVVADFYQQGAKLLFYTAYASARENLFEQVGDNQNDVILVNELSELAAAENFRVILLKSGDSKLFCDVIKTLRDADERIVLMKNIERCDAYVISSVLDKKRLILSGNFDLCRLPAKIARLDFKTKVFFSVPELDLGVSIPPLGQYEGFLYSRGEQGIVTQTNQ